MEYLSAEDVSRMGKAERDNHARLLKLLERREMVKMKGGIPGCQIQPGRFPYF